MKRLSIMALVAVLTATPALGLSVVGSKHDMKASGFAAGTSTEVCVFCHTPHGAQTTTASLQTPLWNNTAVATGAITSFYYSPTMYYSGARAATSALIDATDARMCLACHELGVQLPINMPNAGTLTVPGPTPVSADALLGTNLSNDHPVGMDLGATPEAAGSMNTRAQIVTNFGADPFPGDLGDNNVNVMWCSSCHDVHDNAYEPFLRKNNVGSALCKACHIK